jgi:CheY-like chemotaxis protein
MAEAARVVRVLVAEEDPFIANLLREGITTGLRRRMNLPGGTRFAFEHAHDGAEALSKLEKSGYDLLLCDLALPIVDGLEVIRRVRAVSRLGALKVIALAAPGSDAGASALAAGADRSLEKPVPLVKLVKCIGELL